MKEKHQVWCWNLSFWKFLIAPKQLINNFQKLLRKEVGEPSVHLNTLNHGLGKAEFLLAPGALKPARGHCCSFLTRSFSMEHLRAIPGPPLYLERNFEALICLPIPCSIAVIGASPEVWVLFTSGIKLSSHPQMLGLTAYSPQRISEWKLMLWKISGAPG